MNEKIASLLRASSDIKAKLASDPAFLSQVDASARILAKTIGAGGTIYACGNGGSACDAAHLTEELVARYKRERPGIRAMHFGDLGVLTCWSNDYEYKSAFERQALTFCGPKDCMIGISTSGNSENVLRALSAAKSKGSACIALLGKDGGKIKSACNLSLVVPAQDTERIQETHITIIHIWCELLETEFKAY
ncbi:MAG: SIS domain-containing protein [Oligoflexia bacterium]|nr:SIS domain-containing protein [Oligoflexia bacterium]